jgi:autotransporter passenger strand-loop-strand repeat protein
VSAGGTARFTVVSAGGADYVYSGGVATGTTVSDGGTETVELFGTVSASIIGSGGTETVIGGGTAGGTVLLDGASQYADMFATVTGTVVSSGGTEVVYAGATVNGTIIEAGGIVDLPGLTFTSGGTATVDPLTNILTVTEGGNSYQLTLTGSYTNNLFQLASDATLGTLVTMGSNSPCFVTGTGVATERGEVAIERLKFGDRVRLVDGRTAPIVWTGHRWVDCSRHPNPEQVWPIRIVADAFGPGQPHRDLFLSPDHAVFIEDVLIPVKHLMNRTSIAQVKVAEVTYHHLELAVHDVLIAEGLPAESYLDTGDRSNFDNGGAAVALHPNFSAHIWEAASYAKLVVCGPEVENIRKRLKKRARAACSAARRTNAA